MKRLTLLILSVVGMLHVASLLAADVPRIPQSAVLVDFPIGDLRIQYVESAQGMILDVYMEGKVTCLKARRVYIGDGTNAVKFEATNFGVFVGTEKATQLKFDNCATLEYPPNGLSRWGAKRGEIYLRIPNLKLRSKADEKVTENNQRSD